MSIDEMTDREKSWALLDKMGIIKYTYAWSSPHGHYVECKLLGWIGGHRPFIREGVAPRQWKGWPNFYKVRRLAIKAGLIPD